MKLMDAVPKNNVFKTFWIFSWEFERRSQTVPMSSAIPEYIATLIP
jgi:hypothetical protein